MCFKLTAKGSQMSKVQRSAHIAVPMYGKALRLWLDSECPKARIAQIFRMPRLSSLHQLRHREWVA